jgi:uncharacterized DUF497 family protein
MIEWTRVVGFDWDAGNARKSADKHSVTQSQAEQAFFNQPLLILEDDRHSFAEARFHALGRTDDDRRLQITFTLHREATLIRVISARAMSARERLAYEKGA